MPDGAITTTRKTDPETEQNNWAGRRAVIKGFRARWLIRGPAVSGRPGRMFIHRRAWGERPQFPMTGCRYGVRTGRLPGAGGPGVNGTRGARARVAATVVQLEVWRETVSSGRR